MRTSEGLGGTRRVLALVVIVVLVACALMFIGLPALLYPYPYTPPVLDHSGLF